MEWTIIGLLAGIKHFQSDKSWHDTDGNVLFLIRWFSLLFNIVLMIEPSIIVNRLDEMTF